MKIRQDFVTNSSSSSYVIAYKNFQQCDLKMLEEHPEFKNIGELIENILLGGRPNEEIDGEKLTSKEELDQYLINRYGYGWPRYYTPGTLEEILDEYNLRDLYDKTLNAFKEGYFVIHKFVDYEDRTFYRTVKVLAETTGMVVILEIED